jgi:hypothetical protein
VSVAGSQPRAALAQGLAVGVSASEGTRLQGALVVGGRTVGRGDALIAAKGRTFVFIKLSLRRLGRASHVRGILRLTATDGSGNVTRLSRRIAVVR